MTPRILPTFYPALRLSSFQLDPSSLLTAANSTEFCVINESPWALPDQKAFQSPFPGSALGRQNSSTFSAVQALWGAVDQTWALRGRKVTPSGNKPVTTNRCVHIDNESIFHPALDSPTMQLVLLESVTWPPYRPFRVLPAAKLSRTPCSLRTFCGIHHAMVASLWCVRSLLLLPPTPELTQL